MDIISAQIEWMAPCCAFQHGLSAWIVLLNTCDAAEKETQAPRHPRTGCSRGSGQQEDEGQGQVEQEVIAERRQVIKAAFRALVEAALPDLSPAQ
ncbi:hypothetical protein HaLaN_17210, partial [Haematococcus lacustris]